MKTLIKKVNRFFSLFTNDYNSDHGIVNFCKTEYGRDWFWAYTTYQNQGKFPSIFNKKI